MARESRTSRAERLSRHARALHLRHEPAGARRARDRSLCSCCRCRRASASRAEITLTYSVYMLAYGLSAPFAGQLIDRLGARVAYGFGLASLGLGYLLAGFATELWHYILAVGVLGGLGAASLGMIVASALLSRWFTHRIGAVMSVPYAAVGAGMLILPPSPKCCCRATTGAPRIPPGRPRAAAAAAGDAVAARAHQRRLPPLAAVRAAAAASRPSASGRVSSATRTSAFWGLFAAYLFTSLAAYSVMPHSVAYLIEKGFDPLVAAERFRPHRHAVGGRHPRRRLAVRPLRPPADGDHLLPLDHTRHRLSRLVGGLAEPRCSCMPSSSSSASCRGRAARSSSPWWPCCSRRRRRCRLRHLSLAGIGRRARLLGLGPAVRVDRELSSPRFCWRSAARSRGSYAFGSCPVCARSASRPPRRRRADAEACRRQWAKNTGISAAAKI